MTQQEYLTRLAARFPDCVTSAGAANPHKLAQRENRAMQIRTGSGVHNWGISDEGRARIIATRKAEALATDATVLQALTEPMTREDLHRKTGIPTSTLTVALDRLNDAGKVSRFKSKRCVIWQAKVTE